MRRRRARTLVIAALAALAVALALDASDALQRLEERTIDARFAVRGERDAPRGIVVVGIDERSLRKQRWPFPRGHQVRVVERIRRAEPRLIVYAIAPPDAASFTSAGAPVLVAVTDGTLLADDVTAGSPLFPRDRDNSIRRVDAETGDVPAIAVQAVRMLGRRPPIDAEESAWIDFAGKPGKLFSYSWSRIAAGEVPAGVLRGKVVVVGATAPRLRDVHPTSAGGRDMSAAEIQANAIDTLLRGAPLRSAPGAVDTALVAALALLVPLLALWLGMPAVLAAPPALAILAGTGQLSFENGTIVALAEPAGALLLGAAATGAALLATETRDRRRLRETFARFAPPKAVDALAAQTRDGEGIPATEVDATVMFCDLRGFSTYADLHAPADAIATLDAWVTAVGEAVLAHGGTVVSFLGDRAMAVFGAPLPATDHADRALAAAREIAGPRLTAFNAGRAKTFRAGIGLNSGPVMSGTVGPPRRMEYAAIGDTADVAARVLALTKEYGEPILLTEATRRRLSGAPELRAVGHVPIRGRTARAELYAVHR